MRIQDEDYSHSQFKSKPASKMMGIVVDLNHGDKKTVVNDEKISKTDRK
jgi:hypothetical protein